MRSLRQKFVALVLLTTLVALLVALGAMAAYDLRAYHRGLIDDMSTQAALLGRNSAAALTFDDPRVAQENLGLLRIHPQVAAAAIYTSRGSMFARYLREGAGGVPALPEADGERIEGRQLLVYRRIVEDGESLGTVFLRADYGLVDRIWNFAGIGAAVLALALLVAFFMTSRMQRIMIHPILDIARIAREVIERGDYSRRAQKLSDDEVGALVDSFNAMLTEIERRTGALEQANREVLRLNEGLEGRVRERTAQLEAANRELEAFCYSVSHDLRAPLRAIDGFSQALVEDHGASVPDAGRRYLSRIQSSAKRMGQLIEDLLNLSRVSRGGLERSAVDLGEMARQVVTELRQHEPLRVVEVTIQDGMNVAADPRLLRAALENLLANAWKFTGKVVHPRIEVGVRHDGAVATYFVRDNGAGFDMAYADKLFGAFQRLHAVNDFPGTGIGLATVQRIVNRHGGRIWADGQVGKGAAFYFTLEYSEDRRKEPRATMGAGR